MMYIYIVCMCVYREKVCCEFVEGVEPVVRNGSPQSGEVSPVSQVSPYNMSPLSVSPAGSAGVSPIAGSGVLGPGAPGMTSVLAKIHSRRFREFVFLVLCFQF